MWEDAARPTCREGARTLSAVYGSGWRVRMGLGEGSRRQAAGGRRRAAGGGRRAAGGGKLPTTLVQVQVVQAQVELHVVALRPANAAHGYVYRVGVGALRAVPAAAPDDAHVEEASLSGRDRGGLGV